MRATARSRTLTSLTVVALAAALSACGNSGGGGGGSTASPRPADLVVARATSSQGFEGGKCISDLQTGPWVYDTLLRIKTPEGDGVVGGIAKDYSFDTATKTYTFNLRPDAKFSNGDPVTADDVVFSIDQWRNGPVSGSYYATIASQKAVSDDVVEVTMTQQDSFLPALLTWCTSTIYPKDFAGQPKDEFFKKPIGAGAFSVDSFSDLTGPSESIKLVPNKYFYGY